MNTDFNEILPDKILKQEFLDEYNTAVESIWWQLVSFSSKMIVLDKVDSFRFDLFNNDYSHNHFWNLLISSFYESSILCIWRVSIDKSKDGITLQHLKNKIIQNIVDEEIKNDFKKKLKNLNFEKNLKEINEKIEIIRHNYYAHFNYQKYVLSSSAYKLPDLDFNELKSAHSQIVSYFDLLCFGAQKSVYSIEYDPVVEHRAGIDSRIDVERLLDSIAKESYFIKGEKKIKEIWEMEINQLPDDDLAEINRYRNKFGYSVLRKTA